MGVGWRVPNIGGLGVPNIEGGEWGGDMGEFKGPYGGGWGGLGFPNIWCLGGGGIGGSPTPCTI